MRLDGKGQATLATEAGITPNMLSLIRAWRSESVLGDLNQDRPSTRRTDLNVGEDRRELEPADHSSCRCASLHAMKPITQGDAEQMRETLREIAGFRNAGYDPREPRQAAAIKARETLEKLGLFFQQDVQRPSHQRPQGASA